MATGQGRRLRRRADLFPVEKWNRSDSDDRRNFQALSANCIDGALVFASAAELLGVEPVLIFRTGHAYLGIRSAPGSPVIWPIETTMVGDPSKTPWDAYLYAITNRSKEITTDPGYEEVDVAAMRQAGITPLVQQ